MTGKSHIFSGAALGVIAADSYILMQNQPYGSFLYEASETIGEFLTTTEIPIVIYMPLVIILYFIGTIFPDVDHPYSMIGKKLHLPFGHRTWTHCWVPLLICCIFSIWYRMMFWFGMGIFTHILLDSFSASGVYWFYPLKAKHTIKLYYTNKMSEYVVDVVLILIAGAYSFFIFGYVADFFRSLFSAI